MRSRRIHWPRLAFIVVLGCLAGCGAPAVDGLVQQLKTEFRPGLGLAEAESLLTHHGITHSQRPAAECEALARESRLPAQLTPRGGPCLFGKLPGPRAWYGAHTDVILQLVFTPDLRLADANFEAIESAF